MELISHFNDHNPYEKTECRNALQLLVACSTSSSSTRLHVDFVPPLNAVLERYFNGPDSIYAKMYSQVITVAQMLSGNINSDPEETVNGYIERIKDQLRFEKRKLEIITKNI